MHDQVSYTISPEYFERFKFRQFAFADFGGPPRVLAAEVGFLASWWVGLIGGWVLARLGLAELRELSLGKHVAAAFALVSAVAVAGGTAGAIVGLIVTQSGHLGAWDVWREQASVRDLRAFVVVAFLHYGSYLGALLGIIAAAVFVRRRLVRVRRVRGDPAAGG